MLFFLLTVGSENTSARRMQMQKSATMYSLTTIKSMFCAEKYHRAVYSQGHMCTRSMVRGTFHSFVSTLVHRAEAAIELCGHVQLARATCRSAGSAAARISP